MATLINSNYSTISDFIANAGGVICAAMEYQGSSESAALEAIEEKLRRNTLGVLDTAKREQILPRQASMAMARQLLDKANEFSVLEFILVS